VQQAERCWDDYSDRYLAAQHRIDNQEPAGTELAAMDRAYYRFSFFMHECDRLAAA
jgi:hypothetical protein